MAYTYEIDSKARLVRIAITGIDTATDIERRTREITNDLRWSPGMDALVDFSGATGIDASMEQLGDTAVVFGQLDMLIGDGRLAIVAPRDPIHEIGLRWEAMAQGRTAMKIRVFRDRAEAERWLARE